MKPLPGPMASIRRVVFGVCIALGSASLLAADFSVGRVEVEFAEDGWSEIPLEDTGDAYDGDRTGFLSVQNKLYVRAAASDAERMIVLVSSNSNGFGSGPRATMSYPPTCQSDQEEYREGNTGRGRPFAQCLTVMPRYTTDSLIDVLAPQIKPLRAAGVFSMPRSAYAVSSRHAISTGTFVDVLVIVASPIAVADARVTDTLPKGVLPAHVVWGRRLKDAVKSSVYSLSGRLNMPPLRLIPPAPTGPTQRG